MKARKFALLIVDDNENDRFFLQRGFEKLQANYNIHALDSGDEAILYLKGEGKYSDRTKFRLPSYIITDLKMVSTDGFELLSFIKADPRLASIIEVVMLSASDDKNDISQAYRLGASSFFTKPAHSADLISLIQGIHNYWSQREVPAVDEEGYAVLTPLIQG